MYERDIVGSKYEQVKDMDIKDIAKLVRKDLNEYFKGQNYKISVRIERFSMGQAINVFLSNTGIENNIEAKRDTKDAVQRILDQYDYDKSSTDYSEVNFYHNVYIES